MAEQHPVKKYRANCHCATYVFQVNLPEVKEGLSCNCSYCFKRGGIFQSLQDDDDITFVKGDPDTLSSYSFGDVKHKFCPSCCTYLFRMDSKIYVNIRTFQDFNVWDLDIQSIENVSPLPAWTPPKFTGQEPAIEIEGAKLYTGGCHCGAITIALKSKPIDSTYEGPLVECNCSICTRNAYLWIYPSKPQVAIHSANPSVVGYYSFGRDYWLKSFCRTCGVPVHNYLPDYTPAEIAALPGSEEKRVWVADHIDWSPVNLRVLDGVDLQTLPFERVDGAGRGLPAYVNP